MALNDAATQGPGSVKPRNERLSETWRRDIRAQRLTIIYKWGDWLELPFTRVLQAELSRKLGDGSEAKIADEIVQLLSNMEPRQWNKRDANRVQKSLQGACYKYIKGRSIPKIDKLNSLLAR